MINKKLVALFVLLIFAAQFSGQTSTQGPAGSWLGTVDVGGTKLRVALTLSKNPDGTYSGRADSLDQGTTLPIDVATVNGDSVRLEFKTVGAVYEGKLNADRSEIVGQLSQGGGVFPLTFKRSSSLPAATPAGA